MGLTQVRDEILENAKNEADKIIAEAREQGKKYMEDAEKKLAEYKETARDAAQKSTFLMEKKEIASTKLELNRFVFEKKKEILNKVFEQARMQIQHLPINEKKEILKAIIKKASSEIDIKYVYCNEKDRQLAAGNYAVSSLNISGGVIVENADKTVRLDYSYDTMLADINEKSLQQLSEILFR